MLNGTGSGRIDKDFRVRILRLRVCVVQIKPNPRAVVPRSPTADGDGFSSQSVRRQSILPMGFCGGRKRPFFFLGLPLILFLPLFLSGPAKIFLEEVVNVYSLKFMKASRMLGDQLALAWVVKSDLPFALKKFGRHESFSAELNGVSVLFLPCAVYNWTPPEGAGQFHGMPLDVQVVHFKGSRKRLMLESWGFYNSTSNMSDMLCLVLESGRTKYDF
ncbi:hypothetical protein B296_00052821 [Ensete ventricosum]|uniref:Uncharacterized protein n=1 Tax=Ensete ventricosum TaxID=4639 RepID=A0A426X5B0_ENSVE|nr:hypothetical protein B296_00052821 [Ensete ventricosum]